MKYEKTTPIQKACLNLSSLFLSITGTDQKLMILIYHRVLCESDSILDADVDAETFDWHMKAISEFYHVLPLHEAVDLLISHSLPPRSICITFDDGYADNYEVAFPILKKWNLSATFFIAVGYLNGGCMWNDIVIESVRHAQGDVLDLRQVGLTKFDLGTLEDRRKSINSILSKMKYFPMDERAEIAKTISNIIGIKPPKNIMMTTEQIKQLHSGGMEIGAHTINHPILSKIDSRTAEYEIFSSKKELESIIGEEIQGFAYPNGKPDIDYDPLHVELVKTAGFKYAVSTSSGAIRYGDDRYQMSRIVPWDDTPFKFIMRLMSTSLFTRS